MDPRLTPARQDLAARHLEGLVEADRFVDGEWREVVEAEAPVRLNPSPDATLETEALMGERIRVYEESDEGWAWGQLETDGFVGYLPANALAAPGPPPTHRVAALRTFVFPGPSIHQWPLAAPSLGARFAIVRQEGVFAVTAAGGYVPARHIRPLDSVETDYVAVAERFLGIPYLWGGRTSLGIDCSGLVQTALAACGIPAPRDADMQEGALGVPVAADPGFGNLARGDLVFWKGHVAIMRDFDAVVHANSFHMAVSFDPLQDVIARMRAERGLEPTSVRRL